MLLSALVDTWSRLREVRGRSAKTQILQELLAACSATELPVVAGWLVGELTQGRIGVGRALLGELIGTTVVGEGGLSVAEVDRVFGAVRAVVGAGASGRRRDLLTDLWRRASPAEQQFLLHLLSGELRQGALDGVMIEAVALRFGLSTELVRRAVMITGDLPRTAQLASERGAGGLAELGVELFRPLAPMLAQTAGSLDVALTRFSPAALEWKLDGARVQVHREGGLVRVFSRQLRDVTAAVPEVADLVRLLPSERLVLDGEAIALRQDGSPHPFQHTMKRFGARAATDALRREIPLTAFFFDLLVSDGGTWIDRPEAQRRQELERLVPAARLVPRRVTGHVSEAEEFYEEALARGHEGVMAKDPTSLYLAGARGSAWLKVKAAHTLDLVVVAVEWGSGRRQGWLSNLHLACRGPDGGFVMLGKTFKGLTDEVLAWQTERLLGLATERGDWVVTVRPELVVEVAFNEVQASPRYPGGVALRFARVKRYRPDKRPEEADTLETVLALHARGAVDPGKEG